MVNVPRLLRAACAASVVLGAVACAPGSLPVRSVVDLDTADGKRVVELLERGRRVVVRDAFGCNAGIASSFDALADGGSSLASTPWGVRASFWRVGASRYQLGDGTRPSWLAVRLVDGPAAPVWLRVPAGAPLTCLVPTSEALEAAERLVGRTFAFAPWRETCSLIEARGNGASSLVDDPESAAKTTFAGVEADADGTAWLRIAGSSTSVRADVAATCFEARPPEGGAPALALVHTAPTRCTHGTDGGNDHAECRSSLGVWSGVSADDRVSLRLARRTLGPVHFSGGVPVEGSRYARTVVSVATGKPKDARGKAVGEGIQQSIASALAKGDGSIRVSTPGDPAVGHALQVDAADVVIGDLTRQQVAASSQYQDGTRVVPNPDYARARDRLESARQKLADAKSQYESDVEDHRRNKELVAEAKRTCLQACDANRDATGRSICRAGCEAGGTIGVAVMSAPTRDGIARASAELQSADEAVRTTPATKTEPVMKTWPYQRTVLGRSASTTLRVRLEPREGAPTTFEIPVQHAWEDYEVQADAAHGVAGHEPARGPIDRPESLVGPLSEHASGLLARRLRTLLEQAEIADARAALRANGEASKPGFEDVDAKAWDLVGARLAGPIQRGTSKLKPGAALTLPSEGVSLGRGDCLLAVAVTDGDEATALTLAGGDGAFADLRGKRFASVEACEPEVRAAGAALRLELRSTGSVPVHWGLYRARTAPKGAR